MRRMLRTRWHIARRWRWRVGIMGGEWWIGARYDLPSCTLVVGFLGLVLVVQHA